MASSLNTSKKLMPYSEVRQGFSEARQQLLQSQGAITRAAIQRIQQSRKYAHSPNLAIKRA